MSVENLVRMANQIAAFFQAYPHDEALEGTTGHLRQFWEPEMRRTLQAHAKQGGEGLSPLALEAALALEERETA